MRCLRHGRECTGKEACDCHEEKPVDPKDYTGIPDYSRGQRSDAEAREGLWFDVTSMADGGIPRYALGQSFGEALNTSLDRAQASALAGLQEYPQFAVVGYNRIRWTSQSTDTKFDEATLLATAAETLSCDPSELKLLRYRNPYGFGTEYEFTTKDI